MKTIDTKSLLLGVCAAVLIFTLTSSRMCEHEDNIEVFDTSDGLYVYNKQSKILYYYLDNFKQDGGFRATPHKKNKISDDGSSISEIK